MLSTALATSDGRLHEAATTLGAGRWRIFCSVTLPASRYGLMISWIVVFVLVHVYAAIREDIMSRQTMIGAIINGSRTFRK